MSTENKKRGSSVEPPLKRVGFQNAVATLSKVANQKG
jgi:hypothetical protein